MFVCVCEGDQRFSHAYVCLGVVSHLMKNYITVLGYITSSLHVCVCLFLTETKVLSHNHIKPCNELLECDLVQVNVLTTWSQLLFYCTQGDLHFLHWHHPAAIFALVVKCVA